MKRQKLINRKVSLSRKLNPRGISECEFPRNLLKIAVRCLFKGRKRAARAHLLLQLRVRQITKLIKLVLECE